MTRGIGAFPDQGYPRPKPPPLRRFLEGSRGAEISQVKAEGMRSAEGVLMYVEGVRMPTTKKVKGRPKATFYGCGIYARERLAEQKRMQS